LFLSETSMTRTRLHLLFAVLLGVTLADAQHGPISQQLTFTPYHPSGIYDVGETVGWTVRPGPAAPTYSYKWTIRRNNAVVLKLVFYTIQVEVVHFQGVAILKTA
jgi:hypothetical protein